MRIEQTFRSRVFERDDAIAWTGVGRVDPFEERRLGQNDGNNPVRHVTWRKRHAIDPRAGRSNTKTRRPSSHAKAPGVANLLAPSA